MDKLKKEFEEKTEWLQALCNKTSHLWWIDDKKRAREVDIKIEAHKKEMWEWIEQKMKPLQTNK